MSCLKSKTLTAGILTASNFFMDVFTPSFVVLSNHAPTEDKSDDSKDSFYEELEQVFIFLGII